MSKFLFLQVDKDLERRRALAKVYALLIRLAEEKETTKKGASEGIASSGEEASGDEVAIIDSALGQ